MKKLTRRTVWMGRKNQVVVMEELLEGDVREFYAGSDTQFVYRKNWLSNHAPVEDFMRGNGYKLIAFKDSKRIQTCENCGDWNVKEESD